MKPCTLAAASISLLFAAPSLWANPTGPQVASGQVNFQQPNASVLNVTNSPGAIINWQGFSIGASEVTRFVQQSAASSVLNRVTGGNVSQIYGQLLSNGRVFLINPGGIVVGPGAIVDTAGFVASTLNMLDSDFLAGNLRFYGDGSSGSIINQGWIRTGYGGHVLLVAPTIENSGLIHTPGGDLILAAGQKVTMSTLDLAGVQLEVQAPTDSVVNVGKLLADGGAVGVFAGTLRHSGEIRANSLVYDEAGKVVLKAQNEIQVAAGSATSADGKSGGSVTVQSGGSTRVAGSVSATGTQGLGGSISMLGDRVALVESAALNASGSTGGGQILVGGDYQGANPAIQNSTNTFVGSSASLKADATQNGDGGRIIVWSDDKTQVYGSLSAQGGPQGGNGGFAEISGKQGLVFQGSASLGAPLGGPGTLLLDPLDLYVFAAGGIDLASINELTEFPMNAATVSPATLDAAGASVVLQASRYMRITDAIALNTPGAGLSATVNPYTAPALPDPLALSTAVSNLLELAAGITTVGGAVTLNAPTIQNVAALPISIATSGGAIGLTAASQILGSDLSLNAAAGAVTATSTGNSIELGSITGSTFTASAPSFVFTSAITTTGTVNVTSSASSVTTGIVAAGSGAVSLSGGSISGTVNTTGAVTLTSSSSSINTTVNGASSLTATSPSSIFIGSTTDLNIANVTAGANSTAQVSTTGGSIRGTTAASTVKGLDVQLLTTAGTGGGIGIAGTALNVDVQRGFTFRPNGDFNILLTGTGPNQLSAQLTPAASGTYTGTLTKQGGGLTLNASADTSTVTVSSLNITSGFDQVVFFGSPSITLQTTNAANLVVTSMNVPTGDTVSTVALPNGQPLPVVVSSAGNLTLTNYTRAPGGLAKTTSLTASGSMTLGTVDASKDTVTANAFGGGATVGSLISTGNITLQAFGGALNAQTNSTGVEITSGGTLSIFAQGIGTNGFSNPFDMAAATISLTSSASGAVGGTGTEAVVANTTNLSLNAASGSTFNITTGATSLTNLTVSANPFAVGDAGLARVVTAGGAAAYDFDALAGNFTFNPPISTGRNISFTSSIGNIALGAADLGTGSLTLTSNSGSILTSGASIISAAAVTLNAATDIDFSAGLLPSGTITATGNIGLHGRSNVITGALNTPGQLAVDGNFGCGFCPPPTVSVGTIGGTSAPSAITITGDTITATGAITSAGDVTLNATGGALTLGGALATADGKTIDLTHSGVGIFQFDRINAGATGTVNITSFGAGIEQTADGGADGITAKTVSLFASTGPIHNSADSINFRLDLLGTTNLTVNTSGVARFDMHGSTLTDLTITKKALPATSPFAMANLAVGQSVVIQNGTSGPLEVGVSSTTPLNFSLDTSSLATTMTLATPSGVSTGGGNVTLTSGAGIGSASSGPISTGAGTVTLVSSSGNVDTSAGITTTGGNVDVTAFGGSITTGAIATAGGTISLDAATAIDVSGNLNGGAGPVSLTAGTSVTRSGAFAITSTSSVGINASFGDIGTSGTPMLITSPTVTLDAFGDTVTPSTGRAFATLTGTSTLEIIAENGFNVASLDTAFTSLAVETLGSGTGTPGAGTLNLTAPGQTYTFARPAADLFGPVTNTFQVVAAGGATPPATMRFTALDGTLLVAGPSAVSAADLTLSSAFGGNVSLQGTAANPLTLSGTTQTFSAGTDLLIRGTVSLSATANQSFSAGGNITVNADAGGGGMVAIAAPSQTFSTSGAASEMEFLGGAAAAEKVTVTSTNSQFVQTSSSSLDAFKLLGGSGADSSVTFTHSGTGAQTFNMRFGTLTVAGGSGSNSVAKLEETGTSTQRICFVTFFICDPILSLNVLGGAGTGAFAQVTSAGSQELRVSGTALNTGTTIKGGTGVGAYALVQAASSQTLQNGGRLLVEAGAANDSSARMIAGGTQNLDVNTLSLIAKGIDSAGFQNASAIIESAGQSISVGVGGVTINAGSGTAAGTPSDALLRNTAGSQFVSASGAIILDGGHQFSTAGIINAGTGAQTVSSSGSGITLRSDTDGTHSPHADSVVAIQNQAATLQSLSVTGGGLRLTNSGGGTVGVTSAGSQDLNAMFVEVLTNPSTEAGPNSSTISAATEQHIFTTNTSTSGSPSMRVAALGTGTASVQAGTAQLIELDYPAQMQFTDRDGRLIIGDVNAAGISRVRAGDPLLAAPLGNQTIFAQSITVQAGLVNSISELKATGVQVVSTLQGGIDVLGGSGDNSLAQIDPVQQTILSNGSIQVIAGSGVNAVAQIVANTGTTLNGQTILTTNGDIVLEAGGASGTSASSAFILNTGSSSFVGTSGEIFLTPGTVPGADAIINVGNGPGVLTFLCGAGCSLPPAGTSPTGGILANGVAGGPSSPPPSSSASTVVASATNPILTVEENLELVLVEIAPEGIGEDPLLTRRAPGCL